MTNFHPADPLLSNLLRPHQLRTDVDYVLSPFTLLTELDGVRYCFNTLTKQGLALPPGFDPAARFGPAELRQDPALAELARTYFLKPADRDETKLYEGVWTLLRAFLGKKGLTSFVILPTLACNARCTYCYEAGARPTVMSRETAEQVLTYILKNRRPDTILFLQWFGGEPLLGEEIISFLLEGLQAQGVGYRCGFTTNGSLITPALADRIAGPWRTDNVQITLDGAEELYRQIKRYRRWDDTYHRVLNNVALLADRGVKVRLRINLDLNNGDQVPLILRDLGEAVSAKEQVLVYLSPLYQLRKSEHCLEIWEKVETLSELIPAAGFKSQRMLGLDTRLCAFRCMATNPTVNQLILPDGGLSCCQHQLEGPQLGSVTEGITDPALLRHYQNPGPIPEACRDCPFLPDCTGFRLCPVYDRDCRELRRRMSGPQLRELIRRGLEKETPEADEDRASFDELLYHTE